MRKFILSLFAIVMVASFSNKVMAQSNADSDALATLIVPLSIANDVAMDFKTVAASATAGTVVMTAAATAVVTAHDGATVVSGTPTAGKFTVTGDGTQAFTITLPATASTLTGSVSGDITVDTWTCSEADLNNAALASGTLVFYVGGTLNIDADEVAGLYSGTFNVIVDYN